MSLRAFLFGVSPAGTALSTANVKSVDNVAASTVGATVGTATVVSAASALSASGWAAEYSVNSGSAATIRTPLGATTTTGVYSFYQEADSTPAISGGATGGLRLLNMRFTSAGITIDVRANGTIVLANGSTTATSSSGVWDPTAGTRFDLSYNVSGTSTLDIFAGDSTTPIATVTVGAGTASGTCNSADLGVLSTGLTASWVTRIAAARMDPASTTQLGPYIPAANVPPVPDAGSDQNVNTGATVTLTGSATDSDGTVASTSWTQVDGPAVSLSGSGLSRTFTPTVAGIYTFRFSATDNSGSTVTDDVVVNVRGTTASPIVLTSNAGGWTNQGGAANLVAALADSTDTTFGETPDSPSSTAHVTTLAPLQAGIVTVTTRDRATVASPVITRTVDILDSGDTVRGTTSFALTTTWTAHTTTSGAFSFAAGAVVKVRVSDTQAA